MTILSALIVVIVLSTFVAAGWRRRHADSHSTRVHRRALDVLDRVRTPRSEVETDEEILFPASEARSPAEVHVRLVSVAKAPDAHPVQAAFQPLFPDPACSTSVTGGEVADRGTAARDVLHSPEPVRRHAGRRAINRVPGSRAELPAVPVVPQSLRQLASRPLPANPDPAQGGRSPAERTRIPSTSLGWSADPAAGLSAVPPSRPRRTLHFDDFALSSASAEPLDAAPDRTKSTQPNRSLPPNRSSRPGRSPQPGRLRPASRRTMATAAAGIAAAAALVAVIGATVEGGGSPSTHSTHSSVSHHDASAATSPPSVSSISSAASRAKAAPVSIPVKLISSTSTITTYQLSQPAVITLEATGLCWVQINQGSSSGPAVYTATMSAGETKKVSGPVWIRLGNPTSMTVLVNGTAPPAAPVVKGDPYDLEFAGTASA